MYSVSKGQNYNKIDPSMLTTLTLVRVLLKYIFVHEKREEVEKRRYFFLNTKILPNNTKTYCKNFHKEIQSLLYVGQ